MNISNKIVNTLGKLIAGDQGPAPYKRGVDLVDFFNDVGYDDVYEEGFPTRWYYAAEKLRESNGTEKMAKIIENFADPRNLDGDPEIAAKVAASVNSLIRFDGYQLILQDGLWKLANSKGNAVTSQSSSKIDHDFIKEQIRKCNLKLESEDFNGAITNARSLVEAVLIYITEEITGAEVQNDGNLLNLWKQAKKSLNIDIDKKELPDFAVQVLSGLDSIINGLAGMSNQAGDRHANKFNTKRHHAKLAVNTTLSLCDYLIDLMELRKKYLTAPIKDRATITLEKKPYLS